MEYRTAFPRFADDTEGPEQGLPFHYLDSAATTQRPRCVLEAIERHYRESNANPYRGSYRDSIIATAEYEQARLELADFLGVGNDEVIFTRNATEGLNLVAMSYALDHVGPHDEIALPRSEHHSNLVVWQRVCDLAGASLVYLSLDEDGRLAEGELDKIGPRTKILACAHVSNVLGTIFPLKELAARIHAYGGVLVADCAQSAGHLPLDLASLDIDFAALSGHKMYGPMGIGALYVKRSIMEQMKPFLLGGEMVDAVWERKTTFKTGPQRFEAGTPNVDGALGLRAAVRFINEIGFEAIRDHERALSRRLVERLSALDNVKLYGNGRFADDRLGIASFNVSGTDPSDVSLFLDAQRIAVRTGSHCAQPLHRSLGIEQSCRASIGLYNDEGDIDALIDALGSMRDTVTRRIMGMFP